MSEPFINKLLREEAQVITDRAIQCRKQLGARGGSTTAIRLFGKLGTSMAGESLNTRFFQGEEVPKGEEEGVPALSISTRTVGKGILEAVASSMISFLGSVCMMVYRLGKRFVDGIMSNKIIILGLILSCLFNLFLIGRSTQAYWMDRHATHYAEQIGILPNSHSVMQRSILLEDVEQLIRNGSHFSAERAMADQLGDTTANSMCYNKFQSLALVPKDGEQFFELSRFPDGVGDDAFLNLRDMMPTTLMYSNQPRVAARNRIYALRSKLGIQRNSLMVELRMVNRIESELIMSEWHSWLYDEVSECSRLLQDIAVMQFEKKYQDGKPQMSPQQQLQQQQLLLQQNQIPIDFPRLKHSSTPAEKRAHFMNILRASTIEMRQFVSKYCQSCARELSTLKSTVKQEKEAAGGV